MSKLYLENGYLNFDWIITQSVKKHCPFIFIVGGRGTGKTYGALKHCVENDRHFVFMRSLDKQIDLLYSPELMPFNAINEDLNVNIQPNKINKYVTGFYNSTLSDDGKYIPEGRPQCIALALSTISSLRGFDSSGYNDLLIYDEFIPEPQERRVKEAGKAFLNAIETIGRNREIQGKAPMQVLCLANANTISNDIFVTLKLVTKAESMMRSGQEISYLESRGIMLIMLRFSPISKFKAETSLYRMAEGTDFYDMALNNNFMCYEANAVKSEDLRQYTLLVSVGELHIYRHKSKARYYVSAHRSGTAPEYTSGNNGLRTFRANYRILWSYYCSGWITFETYTLQVLFEKYFHS